MKRGVVIGAAILVVAIGVFLFFGFSPSLKNEEIEEEKIESEGKEESKLDARVENSFLKVNCPSPYVMPNSSKFYSGKLIDTHVHIAPLPEEGEGNFENEVSPIMGGNVKITDYVCMMDYEHTAKAFGFFAVWDPIISESIVLVEETVERYPDRFVPFIMPPDHDDRADGFPTVDAENLEYMLSISPDLFEGYGEIGLYARGDHGGPKGSPELPPDSERLKEIYPVIRKNNLLVYVHLGEGQKESFERALEENPDINFIWHGDQLIGYKENGEQDLSNVEDILYNHPNAYYGVDELYGDTWLIRPEVSKEEFINHFRDYEPLLEKDLSTWKGFIERHPNQVLWGTDRGWSSPWSLDTQVAFTLNNYSRTFIGHLDSEVQEKFSYKNAEKLIS